MNENEQHQEQPGQEAGGTGPVEPMPPEYQEPLMPHWVQPAEAAPPEAVPPQQASQPQQAYYYPAQGAPYQPGPQYQPVQPVRPTQQPYGSYPGYPPYAQPQPYPQAYPQPQPGQPFYPGQPYPGPWAYQAQGARIKKKMSGKVKAFLWILGILTGAMLVFFTVYLALSVNTKPFVSYDDSYSFDERDGEEDETPPIIEPGEEEDVQSAPSRPQVDVTPNKEGIQIAERPQGDTLDAEAVYNRVVPSTVTVSGELEREGQTSESTGTGIIATSDGYIITNSHVVLNSKSTLVTVTTYDGQEYEAVVVGVDRTTDLAVLKTNDYGFIPAEFGDASQLSVGEWVMAIGNPGGERFSSSLTRGIISGLDREVGKYSENGMTYIQTDAAINPGNSGGPLVNMYGQVVGINSSKIITEGYEGMGFAIPVSSAQPIINELLSGGYIKGRTRLGIMCMEVSSTMAQMTGTPRGLRITAINEDSGFAGSGAQEGDIITAIDGEKVESLREVSNLLLRYEPGDQVTITLYRPSESFITGGQELDVTITLLEDKGETQD